VRFSLRNASARSPLPTPLVTAALLVSMVAATVGCSASPKGSHDAAPTEAPSTVSVTISQPTAVPPSPTTSTTAPAAMTLTGKTVVIDPGHNGANRSHLAEISRQVDAGSGVRKECDTTGTAGDDGYPEYAFTLTVAQLLRQRLEADGVRVVMTRQDSDGWGPCITERAEIGNEARADVAISIHADGNLRGGARGFHVILPAATSTNADVASDSAELGTVVRDAVATTGMPPSNYVGANGLVSRGDLGGLNLSTVPKVFVEAGNMRDTADLAMLESPEFQEVLARALADGIEEYLTG
jgi:N-acetylmuramoyl-L-alanine amidase